MKKRNIHSHFTSTGREMYRDNTMKRNFFYQTAYQILIIILPLITAPYVSRVIGPQGVGIYSYTYSVISIFVIISRLGVDDYGNRYIASIRDDKEKLNREFSNIYFLHMIIVIIVGIIYFSYIWFFADEYKNIFMIQGILLLGEFFEINWLFFGLEEFRLTVVRSAIVRTICTVLIFILIKDSKDIDKYTLLLAVTVVVTELLMHFFRKGRVKFVKPDISSFPAHLKGMFILFIPAIAVIVFKIMDKTMLGIMASTTDVGYYENSEKIINAAIALITALGTVMMPRITNMISRGDSGSTNIIFRKSIKFTAVGITAIAFGLTGISKTFPVLFWGEEFSFCQYLLIGLSISLPFTALANVIRTQYLIPYKHDRIFVISLVSGAAVNLVGNIILIPQIQSMGAVISTVIAEFAVFFVQQYKCRKYFSISKELFKLFPYYILGTLMCFAVRIMGDILETNVITLIMQILCGFAIYFSGVLVLSRITHDDDVRSILNSLIKFFVRKQR